MLKHIFQMNARDSRPVDLDPLLGEAGFMNVADVEMNPHPRAVHFVQKLPEFARCDEETLFGAAVLAADPYARLRGFLAESLQSLSRAPVDFVVWIVGGHKARYYQNRIRAQD